MIFIKLPSQIFAERSKKYPLGQSHKGGIKFISKFNCKIKNQIKYYYVLIYKLEYFIYRFQEQFKQKSY